MATMQNFVVRNFNSRYVFERQLESSCQSVKPLWRYNHYSISQDGGRPPSWICYTPVWTTHEQHLVVFVTAQNLVGIGAVVSVLCNF